MGMAASQARFLGLTARKNNVEFEGQQINQQRTTLSNQSANYYNDMLGMAVPTPPSVDSFTKTVYTFADGALTNNITSMMAEADGTYTVSYLSQWEDDFAPVAAATSVVNKATGKYMVGSTELRVLGEIPNAAAIAADEYLSTLSDDQLDDLKTEEQYYIDLLNKKYPKYNGSDWYVRYVENSATGTYTPYFYNKVDLDVTPDANGNIISSVSCYTIGSETKTNEIKGVKGCLVEKDSTGRYISIKIPEVGTDGKPIAGSGTTYRLTTSTITDQDAYDDAMNQYEYEKFQYDQAIEEINAKIAIIQAQDKNLELRLKQLDTEQSAISTEIDAVQQVIEKNTESSFKTFG